MEDEEGQEGFMSTNDEETLWVLEENDACIARKVSGRNVRFKTTRHIREKAKERRERKENRKSNIPMMETTVIHPMTMAKEKADKKKENPRRLQPLQRRRGRHTADCTTPAGQIRIGIHPGIGVNKAGTHPISHPAPDKR